MAADNPRKSVSLGLSRVTGQAEARPTSRAPSGEVTGTLEDRIIAAIETCYDPELACKHLEFWPELGFADRSRRYRGDSHDAHVTRLSGCGLTCQGSTNEGGGCARSRLCARR